tara:strand:- start:333 stop:1448 length:1116 start_codon:yes stop_codon:yes gene_type:complete
MNNRHIRIILLFPILVLIGSCARIYNGSFSQKDFSLSQPNKLGPQVSKWEDGLRTTGDKNEFEWWYFDAKLDNGALFVCYFYKVHFLIDQYFIGMNYKSADTGEIFLMKYFDKEDVSFLEDSCNVQMGDNYFIGNLKNYKISLSPEDFDGFGININLTSKLNPYRPQDGIIRADNDYFAWLASVPDGKANVKLNINGKETEINGSGYHDHNWGNTPLQKLFDGWIWFRGKTDKHTVIAAELFTSDQRGGYDIPILYIADEDDGVIVNRFGENGLFTKYSQKIKNIYNKKNEPYFSTIDMLTTGGEIIKITGEEIIDNSELFKRMGMPWPFRFVLNQAKIDPYYTRFESNLNYSKNAQSEEGFGVLEIMDLK